MNCPICNSEMKKGGVVTDNGEMSNATLSLTWYPEEELKKHNKNEVVTAFTGLLEMSRRSKVLTEQDELFGDITVIKNKKS